MLRGAFSIREQTRGFDHDVDAEIAPRQRRGLALRGDLDGLPVDGELVVAVVDGGVEHAVGRVVLEHVGEDVRRGQVVQRHHLEVRLLLQVGAEEVPSDPSESVDRYASGHGSPSVAREETRAPSSNAAEVLGGEHQVVITTPTGRHVLLDGALAPQPAPRQGDGRRRCSRDKTQAAVKFAPTLICSLRPASFGRERVRRPADRRRRRPRLPRRPVALVLRQPR